MVDTNSSSSSNRKRKELEVASEPRKSQRTRKENNLDHDFISSQAIVFLASRRR